MTKKLPKVSVVIPAYNAEKCLKTSVDSVLKQSYKNTDIIIIDDGSTDGTVKLGEKLAKANPNLRIISQKNGGPGTARNTGIAAAKGDYVLFLDADDLFLPWAVEKLVDVALKTNSDIVCGDMIDSSEPEKVFKEAKDCEAQVRTLSHNDGYKELLYSRLRPSVHAKMYRNAIIGDNRFPPIRYAEDLDFNMSVFRNASTISFIDKPALEIYVLSDNSLMRSLYSPKKQEGISILHKMQKELTKTKDREVVKALKAAIFFHAVGLLYSINNNPETREQYVDDFKELKKMVRKCCRSVAFDKKALPSQKRYALAACTSVEIMLKMMQKAAK